MKELLKIYDDAIDKAKTTIDHLLKYPDIFSKKEHKYLHPFFDKSLFTALNVLDLIIGLKYLELSLKLGNKLEAFYFAKIVGLSSHEILNDLNKLVGKEIRNYIVNTIGQEEIFEMDETMKKLNVIKKNELKKLKNIRNNLLGHKLENGYEQAKILDSMDIIELHEIGYQIFKNQINLIKNYYDIITNLKLE